MNTLNSYLKFSKSSVFNQGKKVGFFAGKLLLILVILAANIQYTPKVYAKGLYDFTDFSNASQAVWQSGAGVLPFPGTEGDQRGFALITGDVSLEGENLVSNVLETVPQHVSNGYIVGSYPSTTILPNERLNIEVGFLSEGFSDGADFVVRFVDNSQNIYNLLSVHAEYDGSLDKVTADLSSLAGKVGQFVLVVNGGVNTDNDNAVWTEAYIEQVTACDLKVDDFWLSGNFVHYRISNVGSEALGSPDSPVEFVNSLEIGNIPASESHVSLYLAPGQSVESTFDYRWQVESASVTVKVLLDVNGDVTETNENNNSMEKVWHLIPDLTPVSVDWSPKLPGLGQSVDTYVVVRNLGNMTTLPCNGLLKVNGAFVKNVEIPRVIPRSFVNVSINWGPVSVGKNNLEFSVDSNNTISETNEGNNVIQATIFGGSQPPELHKPDLVPEGLSWTPLIPKTDKIITFKPDVINLGNVASTTCKLRLAVNGTAIGTVLIPSIPPSGSLSDVDNVTINWKPAKAGNYVLELVVDLDNVVDESNETNNLLVSHVSVKVNDETLPSVNIQISPEKPTELDILNLKVSSSDVVGISSISLYVNDTEVGYVENSGELVQSVGPFRWGTSLSYWVRSEDTYGNVYVSPHYNLTISSSIPIDGKVAVNLSPASASAAYETSAVVTTSFSGQVERIRLYVNDTLIAEKSNQSNLTFSLGRLHAGEVFSYYAEAFGASGQSSRTQFYTVTVSKVPIQLSILVINGGILEGDTIELKGVVSSDDPQLSINLVYRLSDSVNTTIVHPTSFGEFNDVFKPTALGEWEVTAGVTTNRNYFISESQPIKFNVYSRYSLNNPLVSGSLIAVIVAAIIVGYLLMRRRSASGN